MREYDESHPGRSKKDNYTIAIRNEARRQSEKTLKRQYASMALMPLFGIGIIPAIANQYVAQKRSNTLSELMDEYNIEKAKRAVNTYFTNSKLFGKTLLNERGRDSV